MGYMQDNLTFHIIPSRKLLWRNNRRKNLIFCRLEQWAVEQTLRKILWSCRTGAGERSSSPGPPQAFPGFRGGPVDRARATSGLPRIQVRSSSPRPPQSSSQDSVEVHQPRATSGLPWIQVRASNPGPPQAFPGFR